ncbi:lambda-exonuclease family protein [Candidatus Phytoplasma oryzae]|nr:endonuclease [Candidatus Phytoplasma oryzae]
MKIDLKPDSYKWLEYKKKYINDSEIEIIMGLNKNITKEDLIKKKILENYVYENKELELEKITKLHANLFFNILKKKSYEPAVFLKKPFLAFLDGYHTESETMLEIKCPIKKEDIVLWKEFCKQKIIPPYYFARIQFKIYCAKSLKSYFLVYFNEQDYYFVEVQLDLNFIQKMLEETDNYNKIWEKYKKII